MALPEGNFFELLRSVFGNIKTPFNKQKLLDDLYALLCRDEIRKTIAMFINEQDHKLIAAIALLNEPGAEDLEEFFYGELSKAEVNALLVNLEERLIVYRFRASPDEKTMRLAINPVLKEVLSPFTSDYGLLFPSRAEKQAPAKTLPLCRAAFVTDVRIMAALFAFMAEEDELFKGEGVIRKKIQDRAKKIFPGLDFGLAARTLEKLKLFTQEGNSFVPGRENIHDFCGLSPVERQEYWAAAVYLCLNEPSFASHGSSPPVDGLELRFLFRNRLKELALLIHRLILNIESGKSYSEITLRRLWKLLEKESGAMHYKWETLPEVIEKTGLLERKGKSWHLLPIENPEPSGAPVIVMDAAFSLALYPEISFTDAIALSSFCSIKEISGTLVIFKLTCQSAVRGFNGGWQASMMLDLLNRLSMERIESSLEWTLKEWENRYMGVALEQGIILTLAEEHRYLKETGSISRLIQKTLAPGVYLLSSKERTEAVKALTKAGIDIVAQPSNIDARGVSSSTFSKTRFPRLFSSQEGAVFSRGEKKARDDAAINPDEAGALKEKFLLSLEKMKHPNGKQFTKQEKEELAARIDRRLVLSEAQLVATTLRYEKLEARGLDYLGKTVIAKQAVETGSIVEASWPAPDGSLNRTMGAALTLEKKEGESVLVIQSDDDIFRIPLGKISLLRRVKQSIFGE